MKIPQDKITSWENLKASYQDPRAALIPVMHEVQDTLGHLSREAMLWVAEFFDIAPIEVQATASFYWMFRLAPEGKYRISVCKNIACDLRGKDEVLRAISDETGLKGGHHAVITEDGLFSLRLVECMGSCSSAPMMDINGDYHENLDYDKTRDILGALRQKGGAK